VLRRALSHLSRRVPRFRGKVRLTRLADRLLLPSTPGLRVSTRGVTYRVEGRDWIEFHVLYHGGYALHIVDLLAALAPAGGVFWDVGANIGTTSLAMVARVPGLSCIAFEPSPPVLARLCLNAQLNPALQGRLRVLSLALSDRPGPASFFLSSEPENSGVGGLGPSANRLRTPVTVWAARGDDLIAHGHVPPPTLLKLDVEGHELAVLTGLDRTLRAADRLGIVFEHSLRRLAEQRQPKDAVAAFLRERGFELLVPDGTGLRPLEPVDLDRSQDIVARKT
jgi:FkbM family methyltransferase